MAGSEKNWMLRIGMLLVGFALVCLPAFGKTSTTRDAAYAIGNDATAAFIEQIQKPTFRDERLAAEVILIPENKGWLISILLPYIAPNNHRTRLPDLFVVPKAPSQTCDRFLASFKDRKVLSFINPERIKRDYQISFTQLDYFSISDTPFMAALQLANAFTDRIPQLVLASMKSPKRFLQTAVFASQYGLPIIPFRHGVVHDALDRLVRNKKVQKAYLVSDQETQTEMFDIGFPVESLSIDQINHYSIRKMGVKRIRNIITARPAVTNLRPRLLDTDMIHFVPYISLLRNAPLVLLKSKDGLLNEKRMVAFIRRHRIRPRTITVVGDYKLLHPIQIEDDLDEQIFGHKHTLERELMSRPEGEFAFPYGVGRLPFSKLPCISMYYARLAKLREIRRLRAPRFTMIANLDSDKRARLMLAESISRTTVQELRNFQLKGSEHYGQSPSNKRIWNEALNADLLIYEGHIEQFSLIKNTGNTKDLYQGYQAPLFSRFPFVVLQACHSLKNAELLLNKGVSGLVGSCSKIHSASGSAFIKAYIDAMLYGKVNTGEALRDAKNYALSLVKLKCARGHLEQDKTMRVALSFRLVGDPEVKLFPRHLTNPAKKRLMASFTGRRTVEISTPPAHYPLVETKGYQVALFPGAETAGIVSRLRDDPSSVRKLHSLYYFRLPIPPDRSGDPFVFASCEKSAARNISLRDPFNRWIYLLHYPRTEKVNSKIKLTFEESSLE